MERGGQVALFAIIGIVLLISVSFVFYIARVVAEDQIREEARESISSYIELTSMNQLVESCLEEVSTRGFLLASRQGGVIYDYQGGLTPSSGEDVFIKPTLQLIDGELQEINVSYALLEVDQGSCLNYQWSGIVTDTNNEVQSFYPVRELPIDSFISTFVGPENAVNKGCLSARSSVDIQKSGFLGYSTLAPLCSSDSGNSQDSGLFGRNACSLQHFDDEQNPSLQRNVEAFIEHNLPACVNFSYFEEIGNDVNVDFDGINVTTKFQRPEGVQVSAKFPFIVSVRGRQPIIEQIDFASSVDIDFVNVYSYIYDLTLKLARDPFFILERDWNNQTILPLYSPSFSLDVDYGTCDSCLSLSKSYDDVITITDTNSFIESEPVSFSFALRQRRPVLDYLHHPGQSNRINNKLANFVYFQDEVLELSTLAIDPNGDELSFSFSGWKEDFDTVLDTSCCLANADCTLANYQNTECFLQLSESPQYWSTNFLQQENTGYASYTLKETDIGFHELVVIVEDEHGAKDFQPVRILVFDSPLAELEGKNTYDDIIDTVASVEDPYIFDATTSRASVFSSSDISTISFRSELEGFEIFSEELTLELPLEEKSFSDIVFGEYKKSSLRGEESALDTITVVIRQDNDGTLLESPPASVDVAVGECLPHGFLGTGSGFTFDTSIHYNIPPYSNTNPPYYFSYTDESLTDAQKFNQPHICCEPANMRPNMEAPFGLGVYAQPSQSCFSNDNWYSCFPRESTIPFYLSGASIDLADGSLKPYSGEAYLEAGFNPIDLQTHPTNPSAVFDNLNSATGNAVNDIYKIEYEQSCSGRRGNTCSGEISMRWEQVALCNDLDSSIGQFARCQGPGVPSLNRPFSEGSFDCAEQDIYLEYGEVPSCFNFESKESFEKNTLSFDDLSSLSGSTKNLIEAGFCAPSSRADVTKDGIETGFGTFSCGATCNGDGGCDYNDISVCSCEQNFGSDSQCDGVSATAFFATGSDNYFFCSEGGACLNSCEYSEPEETVEACHCKRTGSGARRLPGDTSFFIDDDGYTSTENSPCCAGNNIIYSNEPVDNADICFQGKTGDDRDRFSLNTVYDVLACDGQFYFCAEDDVCAEVSGGNTDGDDSCLVLQPNGVCSYTNTDTNTDTNNNDECAQEITDDLQAIANLPYIEAVKNSGSRLCARTCTNGRWL